MDHKKEDLRPYRRYGFTLLQLMGLIGLLGIVGIVVLRFFF